MIGEVRQDKNTGQIAYLEWLYDRAKNNALVMQMGALCKIKGIDMEQPAPQPSALSPVTVAPQQPRIVRDSVPIYPSNQGASVLVDVILGGQPARLMLDTGATTSLISRSLADAIVRSGNGSWQESKRFRMADGSVRTAPIVLIKDVRIGRHVVDDVEAGVSDSDEMLLAFPVVNGIAPFTINTRTRELIFDTSVARN
jgi:predicted aspartyl protease